MTRAVVRSWQDPALLRVLLPCFTTHFPGVVGNIYIAPVNSVFYAIWSLVSLLLDAGKLSSSFVYCQRRFHHLCE